MKGEQLAIRGDLSTTELCRPARREPDRTAVGMGAIVNALHGMTRAKAARLPGVERQALRDAVLRHTSKAWQRPAQHMAGSVDKRFFGSA